MRPPCARKTDGGKGDSRGLIDLQRCGAGDVMACCPRRGIQAGPETLHCLLRSAMQRTGLDRRPSQSEAGGQQLRPGALASEPAQKNLCDCFHLNRGCRHCLRAIKLLVSSDQVLGILNVGHFAIAKGEAVAHVSGPFLCRSELPPLVLPMLNGRSPKRQIMERKKRQAFLCLGVFAPQR